MRILAIDIETAPALVETYRTFGQQSIDTSQILRPIEMISYAAQWYGEKKMHYWCRFTDGQKPMLKSLWGLLDEADAVLHFNGTSFDMPHINREFLVAGMSPPSPYKQIDLWRTSNKVFRFTRSKLAQVTAELGLKGKVEHEGMILLARRCREGDKGAIRRLAAYNKRDVSELIDVYERLLPWIQRHPNVALHDGLTDAPACTRCGSADVVRRGFQTTAVSTFQRWRCKNCCGWFRATRRDDHVEVTEAA